MLCLSRKPGQSVQIHHAGSVMTIHFRDACRIAIEGSSTFRVVRSEMPDDAKRELIARGDPAPAAA